MGPSKKIVQTDLSGEKIGKKNNLAFNYPEIALEWDFEKNGNLSPYNVSSGTDRKVWRKCSKNPNHRTWIATVGSRTRGQGCPECYEEIRADSPRLAAIRRGGSLADNFPEIAKQWHPTKNGDLTPNDVSANSGYKVWWVCDQGREWESKVNNRHGKGCRICSYQIVAKKIREFAIKKGGSLADNYPDLVGEWHPIKNGDLRPMDFPSGSPEKVWWRCSRGYE